MSDLPLLAIVGRPNVGKSTLFNRLVGRKLAIIDDMPGVTRDRLYAEASWFGRRFSVVDTGGYEPVSGDSILAGMREQARIAVQEADLTCLVVDARAGLTPADVEVVEQLRKSGRPMILAVNKVDGPSQELLASEFYELGLDDVYTISAAHGRGVGDLVDRILELLPDVPMDHGQDDHETRVAFIGRPNVGKSTLVNRLLGEDRCLVSDVPGTTRDPVDTVLRLDDKTYRLIDTAGIRRKSRIKLDLERYTVVRAFRAIDRAHVVCFLIDARYPVADQDSRIAAYAARKGRAAVVLLNKWDLLDDPSPKTLSIMIRQLREQYGFLPYAPVIPISAKTGRRVAKVLEAVDQVREQHLTRIPTGPLNRIFRAIVSAHHPPLHQGKMVKFYFITQTRVAPPTFVVSCNRPDGVPEPYKRYIENRLRREYPFTGTPLKFIFKSKRELGDEDGRGR